MKPILRTILALGFLVTASISAWAGVSVTFAKPETYNDMPWSVSDKEQILKTFTEHFSKLGGQLPSDQDLKIVVTNIGLAGRVEPAAFRGTQEIRILRGRADWPSMQLHYSLESKGQVLQSGDDKLADMTYLDHHNRYPSNESLRYEKQMIDSWFQKKFITASR